MVDLPIANDSCESGNSVTDFEVFDRRTNSGDDAADIASQNVGVFCHDDGVFLEFPVGGINRNGMVANDDFVGTWGGNRSGLRLHTSFGAGNDIGEIEVGRFDVSLLGWICLVPIY